MSNRNIKYCILVLFLLLFSSCTQKGVGSLFTPKSPYEKYLHQLELAKVVHTHLGKEWIQAGERAVKDTIHVRLPFREKGYLSPTEANALSYSFRVKRGQVVYSKITFNSRDTGQLFIDLFEKEGDKINYLESADSTLAISYEANQDKQLLLRLQPELLIGGNYTVEINTSPSLPFPIPGKDSKAIGSFYGAQRDGGKRRHEGIDIFVPKHTPVIAIAAGTITSVQENRLGGKVVFLSDFKRNHTLYYAHLDTQLVSEGEKVEIGDTIGLVGNTGNARFTPPHLHFGIYTWNAGAVDPLPFLARSAESFSQEKGKPSLLSKLGRTNQDKVFLIKTFGAEILPTKILSEAVLFTITGMSSTYYKILLPDGESGFIKTSQVADASEPVEKKTSEARIYLFDFPGNEGVLKDSVEAGISYKIHGRYKDYVFVGANNKMGWAKS